jgi:ATP-dependent DNA helicase RecQ
MSHSLNQPLINSTSIVENRRASQGALSTIDPLHSTCLKVLKQSFGYDEFRDGQWAVIESVLNGNDSLILLPTGGGKSICYQLPALILEGLTIVVSPLISLMQDQVQQLQAQGVEAAYINSSLASEQINEINRKLHSGDIDILYVAPERLLQSYFLRSLQDLKVSLIAVDEAHCVSQWGHDFRKEYRRLHEVKQAFPNAPLIALTATADHATQTDIIYQLNLHEPFVFRGGFDRPNIRYNLLAKYKGANQVVDFVKQQRGNSGIVYCNSRAKVDELVAKLSKSGINCGAYHAGKETPERERIQNLFLADDLPVVVATVAFGMGINKSNVRFVIHHDVPRSIESFYQETGRAGRDGMPAEALLLFDDKDAARIKKWIADGATSERFGIEMHKFEAMQAFAEAQTCRRQVLLNYFGDHRHEICGNCDICQYPPKMFDGSIVAQKLLSCIYRLRGDTAITYVIDVLRGKQHHKILDNKHNELSTYGIGKKEPDQYWHNIIQQIIHQGHIRIDMTLNGILRLNESAKGVLSGNVKVQLAVPKFKVSSAHKNKYEPSNIDKVLFAKLKNLRKQLSVEQAVPAFTIFSDASLSDMAARMPINQADFLNVTGVGEKKLVQYGEPFTRLIADYLSAK